MSDLFSSLDQNGIGVVSGALVGKDIGLKNFLFKGTSLFIPIIGTETTNINFFRFAHSVLSGHFLSNEILATAKSEQRHD